MKKLVVYISGCSGVGKNTLINGLIEKGEDIKFLISYTTRQKRDFEVVDEQYHFVNKDEFIALKEQGKILEYDEYNGNYYGHCLDSIETGLKEHAMVIKDLTVSGVKQSIENIGDKYNILPIFLTESKSVIKKRLQGRGEKQIKSRMSTYDEEHKSIPYFKYVIRNNIKSVTIDTVQSVLKLEQNGDMPEYAFDAKKISAKKVEILANRLKCGKKAKPVEAILKDGKLYIFAGVDTYLAGIKEKINTPIYIIQKNVKINNVNSEEWTNLIKKYKK